MFLVKDTSAAREARITQLATDDPALALITAIIHVEWTLRRAIIALGSASNVEIRHKLGHCHGPAAYKQLWRGEVTPRTNMRLPDVIRDWDGLLRAFRLRHTLVHGIAACSAAHAAPRIAWALAAARDVRGFCAAHGVDLDARLPVRPQARTKKPAQPGASHAPVS